MKTRAIIPCAGFGERMHMPINRSKEMLPDPHGNSRANPPLVEVSLDIARRYDLDPLVITRSEKKDLIEYCANEKIECIIVDDGKEWSDTVLKSQAYWAENNILLFPDGRFHPLYAVGFMQNQLKQGSDLSLATFSILYRNAEKWCTLSDEGISEKMKNGGFAGIGIIGFKKTAGLKLFTSLSIFQTYIFQAEDKIDCVSLNAYIDLTRNGKIDDYQ